MTAFPFLHRALPLAVGLVGGAALALYLYRRPPQTAAQACNVGGVVMAVITLLAPATRIGYLLYPINFFVWGYLFSGVPGQDETHGLEPLTEEDLRAQLQLAVGGCARGPAGPPDPCRPAQSTSWTWMSSREKEVAPVDGVPAPNEVGEITAPISQ